MQRIQLVPFNNDKKFCCGKNKSLLKMRLKNKIYSLFLHSICVDIGQRSSNVLTISSRFSRVTVRLFLLLSCAFIYFVCFIRTGTFSQLQDVELLLKTKFNRKQCCLSPGELEDICGRKNCTLPACTDPEPSIPELEIDPANSHFSRDEKDSAFFIETSGSGSLSFRQSCAVESLAFHNPNLTVYVLFVNVQINSSVITLQKLRGKYGNIRLISINLDDYMAGTALEHWYHCIHWKKGPYHVNNLSNGLRLLTLAKYGGYYFDLDFVFVRSLIKYYRNFVAAQDNYDVNNGVIHAELKSPIIELAMTNFVNNFSPWVWGHNGPALIYRVLKNWCNVDNVKSMDSASCRGFNILPRESFFPVHYTDVKELFIQRMENETEAMPDWLTDKVVGVHTWNKISKSQPIYKSSRQDYARLVRDNCPVVFSIAPEIF